MNIVILGASGSIGTQAIDILKNRKGDYSLVGFSVGNNVQKIDEYLKEFDAVKYICVKNYSDYKVYKNRYRSIKFYYGDRGLVQLIRANKGSVFINSLVGFTGLKPSIEVLKNKGKLLLANKESLVIGGELLKKLEAKYNSEIIPIDSEHVAVKKCLYKESLDNVKDIYITASGGPFFDIDDEKLKNVTLKDALNHPNRKMGSKITIDSATMMNKTFELIEGYYLFNVDFNKIKVKVDRKSMVHGFVIFKDGRDKENVSKPNMKDAIEYALNFGNPSNNDSSFIDTKENELKNYPLLDMKDRYTNILSYAKKTIENKGNYGAALSAANEAAVNLFLKEKISFIEIEQIINIIMKDAKIKKGYKYNLYKKMHRRIVKKVNNLVEEKTI